MIAVLVSFILRPSATSDPNNFKIWEKRGYHIIPMSYYSPIPDTSELSSSFPPPTTAPTINFRTEYQLELLREFSERFSNEYKLIPRSSSDNRFFALDNDAFTGIDPLVYYCMLRYYNPKLIIEIGSGHSTILACETLKNHCKNSKMIVIDPWPREFTKNFLSAEESSLIEHIQQKVEDVEFGIFNNLQENDFLFIDSSHIVRTGSDVCFLILEVLPRLNNGVIVHHHDIFLPDDYPINWILNSQFFFSEQYLLQAYLTENNKNKILFTSHHTSMQFPDLVSEAFPNAGFIDGGSFWFQRELNN